MLSAALKGILLANNVFVTLCAKKNVVTRKCESNTLVELNLRQVL